MGKIIAVVNQKGGVGKTTSAVNLTAALHDAGKRVLLCDFDPQANATSGLGLDKRKLRYSVYDVIINDVPAKDAIVKTKFGDVLPSTADLAGAVTYLPLDAPERWVRQIAEEQEVGDRKHLADLAAKAVVEKGFDIGAEAEKLLRIYCK